jgi:hypothetical protein
MENLQAEMSALRGEVKELRQVLQGFEGFGGLVRTVMNHDERLRSIENFNQRRRGIHAALGVISGLFGAGLGEFVIHRLFGA